MSELRRLPRAHRALVLGTAVLAFLFVRGPAWWDPFDHARLWFPITFSYLLIPIAVAALMLARRSFAWRGFVVDSVEIVAAKFLITATFMTIVWSLAGPPPREPLPEAVRPTGRRVASPPWTPPAPAPRDPATLGAVRGIVTDEAGAPVEGAVAWIDAAFDGAFAVREDVVVVEGTPDGPEPRVACVQAGQPLLLRSTEERLHAYRGTTREGVIAFQLPVLPASRAAAARLPHASGETRLTCTAHAETRAEHAGLLVVLAHPFFARTAADGSFALTGVPAGAHGVVVVAASGARASAEAVVTGGAETTIAIRLGP